MHLVKKINLSKLYPDCPVKEVYMYGEASAEANLAMQEPLKKLYEYENQKNTQWISVKDRLPDKAGTYLVLGESSGATVAPWYEPNEYREKGHFGGKKKGSYVKYWMPRPATPNEKGEK